MYASYVRIHIHSNANEMILAKQETTIDAFEIMKTIQF